MRTNAKRGSGKSLRFITLAAAIALAFSMLFVFASCDENEHECTFDKQNPVEAALASEATCTEKATYYYSCECGELGEETFEWGDFGYHSLKHKRAVAATATRPGNIEYWVCLECDGYFSDSYGKNAISDKASVVIPATGNENEGGNDEHTCVYDKEVVNDDYLASAADCDSAAKYYYSCECGKASDETFESGEALGHTLTETVDEKYLKSAADCMNAAIYYKSCSVCGEKSDETFEYGDPSNTHTYDNIADDKYLVSAATCEKMAVYYKSCTVCGLASDITFRQPGYGEHNYIEKVDVKHFVSAADCDTPALYYKSCSECGKASDETFESGEALGHTMYNYPDTRYLISPASCTSAALYYKSCSVCGAKGNETFSYGSPSSHIYVEKVADRYFKSAADCTTPETYYKSCSVCGVKGSGTFTVGDVASHSFIELVDEDYLASAASCTSPAKYYKSCEICGEASELTFENGEALEHDLVISPEDSAAPTCSEAGYDAYRCSVCGGGLTTTPIAATGHDFDNEGTLTEATCQHGEYTTYTCNNGCGETDVVYNESVPATDHSYSVTASAEADCVNAGYTTYTCSFGCGSSYTEDIPATGHDNVSAECEANAYCSCGALVEAALGHKMGETPVESAAPTCLENGWVEYKCIRCEYTERSIPEEYMATDHNVTEWFEEQVLVEDTNCTYKLRTWGYCENEHCANYEGIVESFGEAEIIHKCVWAVTVEATCTVPGTKTFTCTECGHSYEEEYSAEGVAHIWDEGVEGIIEGSKLYSCVLCSKQKVEAGTSTTVSGDALKNEMDFNDASLSLDETLQNTLEGDVNLSVGKTDDAVNKENILGADGNELSEEEKTLIDNGEVYEFTMTDAEGNPIDFGEGTVTVKIPYPLSEGEDPDDIIIWYLAVKLDEETGEPVVDEVSGEYIYELTYTETEYVIINGEGFAVFTTSHFSYYTVTKMSPAQRCQKFGHNFLTQEIIRTCLGEGYVLNTCLRCGYRETSNHQDPLGHEWVYENMAPSCSYAGYESGTCSRCSVSFKNVVEATGHDWQTVSELAASCTTAGYKVKACSVCGLEITTDKVEPLGHLNEERVTEPNCQRGGYTEHYCSRCDSVYLIDNETEKTDHDWNVDNPDCEKDKFCRHCKAVDKNSDNNGKAKGHKYDENGNCEHCEKKCDHNKKKFSHDKAPSCASFGSKMYHCPDCGNDIEGERIPKEAHRFKGGVCVVCGAQESLDTSSDFYTNIVKTFFSADGFTVQLKDFTFKYEEPSGLDIWFVSGAISQVDVAELSLYIDEDGALAGAGYGKFIITNGPTDGDVTASFELLVEDGYIYVNVKSDNKLLNTRLRYSFDEFLANSLDDSMSEGAMMLLGFAKSDLVPLLVRALEYNGAEVEGLLESVFNMLFSYDIIDGEYRFYLDTDKIYSLIENLATMPVADVIDLYFGEGAFDEIQSFVYELMALTVSEIPEYVEDKLGISRTDLYAFLNEYCALIGAPEDFDIADVFASEDAKMQIIGSNLIGEEAYVRVLEDIFAALCESTIFELQDDDEIDTDKLLKNVRAALDEIGSILTLEFAADANGVAKRVDIFVEPTVVSSTGDGRYILGFDISVIIDAITDIDFSDMKDEVDTDVERLPALEDEEIYYNVCDGNLGSDKVEYNGEWYEVSAITNIRLIKGIIGYSSPIGYLISEHCAGWLQYQLSVMRETYRYDYRFTYIPELSIYLIYDYAGNSFAFTVDDNGIASGTNYIGEAITFVMPEGVMFSGFTYEQLALCFGELDFELGGSYMTDADVYLNKATGEISYESVHNYVLAETKLPTGCADDGYEYYVCDSCGDSYYYYYNDFEHNFELDLENSNLPTECETSGYKRYTCTECGEWYNERVWKEHNERIVYSLHEGAKECKDGVDAVCVCTDCGITVWIRENYISGHAYVREWTLEGNVLASTTFCAVCKDMLDSDFRYRLDSVFDMEVSNPDGDHPYLKFKPSVSGIYELFSKENGRYGNNDMWARLYDENMAEIYYSDDEGEDMNFGILCNLEAGKTYYLKVGFYSYGSDSDTSICVRPYDDSKNVAIPLAEYGCTCGTVMMLMYQFDTIEVVEQRGEGKCALEHYGYGWEYESDDACNEICSINYNFYNPETGEDFFVTVYSYYTGKTSHSDVVWEWFEESGTVTDEGGNELRFDKWGEKQICYACGSVIEKREESRYYNENGECVRGETNRYEVNPDGELYLSASSVAKYEIYEDNNGNTHERVVLDAEYQYDVEGNVTFWMERTFTYDGCHVIRETKSSNGKNDTEEFFDHRKSEKLLDKECSEEMIDGLLVITNSYESYCTECAASLEKRIVVNSYDADGNCVKSEWSIFVPYAVSETEGGWRLNRSEVRTYAAVTNSLDPSLKRTVTLTEEYIDYDETGNATRWIKYTYEYKNGGYCEYDRIFYDVINDRQFVEWEDAENHEYTYYYKLSKGSETCTDGLDQWNICTWCGYEYLYGEGWSYEHSTVEYGAERIYSSEFGAQCGGYIELRTCPCGERKIFNTNNLKCEIINDGYDEYDYNPSYGIYEYYLYTYGCAVTHNADGYAPCGFEYTYEHWYSVDENCRRTYHHRYVIGTNTDNPVTVEWEEAHENDYWHPETESKSIDGSYRAEGMYEIYTEGTESYCLRCGMRTAIDMQDNYVKDGEVVKIAYERIRYNNDGSYYVEKDTDEAFRNDELGFKSAWEETYYSYARYNADGTLNYLHETIYEKDFVYNLDRTDAKVVVYKEIHNEYYSIKDLEAGNPSYFSVKTYDYSDCACNPRYVYEDSNGYYEEGLRNNYDPNYYYWHYSWLEYWVTPPTCTQEGTRALACTWCDGYEYTWTHSPYGHSYDKQDDGSYICSRCELVNFVGYDGSAVLEDLTWKEGNGDSYVIGYYLYSDVPYDIYVSLIIDDGTEFGEEYLLNSFIKVNDTGSMIFVSIDDVIAAINTVNEIEGTEYSICTNMIRISLVPETDEYDCDYAITLDPHVLSYTADISENGEAYTHKAVCSICGFTKDSHECSFYNSYEDEKTIDGITYEIYELRCRHCDNFYRETRWVALADADKCLYSAFTKYEWNGGERIVEGDAETRHKFDYVFDSAIDENGSFNARHYVSACIDCGYVEDKVATIGSCNCNGWSFTYVDENGKTVYVSHYRCYKCGFSYKYVYYYQPSEDESCVYDIIRTYYWGYLGDGVYESSVNGEIESTYIHNYSDFSHIDVDSATSVPRRHTAVCIDCGVSEEGYCSFKHSKENVDIDGITHTVTTYTCTECGFEYVCDLWDETVKCGYITYRAYSWYYNGEQVGYTNESENVYHTNSYEYTVSENTVIRTCSCDVCGEAYDGGAATVVFYSAYTLTPITEGTEEYFVFELTVDKSGIYNYYSANNNCDTVGYIYGEDGNMICSNDDGADNNNFFIKVELNEGATYYLVTRVYSEKENSSYNVLFEDGEHTHILNGIRINCDEPILADTEGITEFQDVTSTCSSNGHGYFRCDSCGELNMVNTYRDHDLVEGESYTETVDGVEVKYTEYTCNDCGETFTYEQE